MGGRSGLMALCLGAHVLLGACEDVESHREPGGILTTPATPPRPVEGDGRNPPPLDNLRGYPGRAAVTGPDTSSQQSPGLDPPEAQARLGRRIASELQGVAKLQEVRQGVELELDVDHGKPGASRVILAEQGSCSRPDQLVQSAQPVQSAAAPQPALLGTLQIAEDGEGSLEATIPNATLRMSEPATLLGKELVVVAAPKQGQAIQLLACASIERAD